MPSLGKSFWNCATIDTFSVAFKLEVIESNFNGRIIWNIFCQLAKVFIYQRKEEKSFKLFVKLHIQGSKLIALTRWEYTKWYFNLKLDPVNSLKQILQQWSLHVLEMECLFISCIILHIRGLLWVR